MKKFPGSVCSLKLLYDKSSTSNTGNAPKPRGSVFKRLIEQLRIRNLGIDDNDNGSSSKWLFEQFRISRFTKLAMPGGNMESLLWLRVMRVRNVMFTKRRKIEENLKRCVYGSLYVRWRHFLQWIFVFFKYFEFNIKHCYKKQFLANYLVFVVILEPFHVQTADILLKNCIFSSHLRNPTTKTCFAQIW